MEVLWWLCLALFIVILAMFLALCAVADERKHLARRLKLYEPFDHDGDGRPGGSRPKS